MKGTCSASDCERPASVRGICATHYQRMRKYGSLDLPERHCTECGVLVSSSDGGRKRCDPCGIEYARKRQSEWHKQNPKPRKAREVRSCVLCGAPTPPSTRGRLKCDRCAQESVATRCGESGCDRPARARKMCAMHYKRAARAAGVIVDQQVWDERRRANYARRRALKKGSEVGDPFTNTEIFERDRWRCHLCRRKVKSETLWPDPLSASLDHLVPLSEGGAHSRENVALAHLQCNVRKGNRAAGEQLALIG